MTNGEKLREIFYLHVQAVNGGIPIMRSPKRKRSKRLAAIVGGARPQIIRTIRKTRLFVPMEIASIVAGYLAL